MARYKVTNRGFYGAAIREAGEEIDFAGLPGAGLEPLDDAARKAAEKAKAARAARGKAAAPAFAGAGSADGSPALAELRRQVQGLDESHDTQANALAALAGEVMELRRELAVALGRLGALEAAATAPQPDDGPPAKSGKDGRA